MKSYKKFVDTVNKGTLWLTIAAMSIMAIMVVLQVVFRYVIQSSLSFSEELARFMFVWTTFLGSAIALSNRKHVSVDILVAHLPKNMKKTAIITTNCLSLVFFALLIVYGVLMVLHTVDQTSPAMGLSMSYVYASVPVAGLFMLLNGICNAYEEFTNPDIIKSEGVE